MSDAELRIQPVMVGDAAAALSPVRQAANDLARDQQQGMTRSRRAVDRLRSSYRRVADTVGRVRQGVGSVVDNIFSMRTAVAGIATGVAGRTVFGRLIGSNIELEQQRVTFEAMLGDVEQAETLIGNIREFAAGTPFQQGDLIEGSRTLLRITEDNVAENERLLNVAAEMSALTGGERGVAEAAEALTRAGAGQLRGLRSFGLRLTQSDIEEIREDGEELGDAAVRAAVQEFEEMTEGEDLVGMLSQTVGGRISTLRDNFSELMREAGEPAFEAFGEGVDDVTSRVEELRADPRFMRQMEDFGEWMGDVSRTIADFAPTLIERIPSAVESVGDVFRQIRDFYDSHPRLVQVLVGAVATNRLTGGMLGDLAGGALRGGIGLLGRGGSRSIQQGAGSVATGMMGGKCCCPPGMGAGAGRGRTATGGATAAGTAARAAAGGLTAQQLATVGAGTLASGGALVAGGAAVPLAAGGAMMAGWADTLEAGATTEAGNRITAGMERRDLFHGMSQAIEQGEDEAAARQLIQAMGGPGAVFTGTEEEQNVLDMAQGAASRLGFDFDIEEGQTVADAVAEMGWRDDMLQTTGISRLLGIDTDIEGDLGRDSGEVLAALRRGAEEMGDTTNNYDIDLHFENPPDAPQEMKRMMEQAARDAEMRR